MTDLSAHSKMGIALIAIVLVALPPRAGAETTAQERSRADGLALEGRYTEAEAAYRELAAADPQEPLIASALGRMLLYRNSLQEAEAWLRRALTLDASDRVSASLLAECLCRRDQYAEAAALLESIGAGPKAATYRRLAQTGAYRIEPGPNRTTVPFLLTDPLPVVRMRVDGYEGCFLIDTGAWEIALNADFAGRLELEKLGEQIATFAGGQQARTWHAVTRELEIGDFVVHDVPVTVNERGVTGLPGFAEPICGIVGTVFLYHFAFTLDYPGGALCLERPSRDGSGAMRRDAESRGATALPLWLCGDHFFMTWGAVNEVPAFLFIDTGMAGGGFSVSEELLRKARIEVPAPAGSGVTGAGTVVPVRRIQADLALGAACEAAVPGFFGAMPPGMSETLGFRIDGIISHGFFRPYRCVFDVATMTLYLTRGP